MNVNSAASEFDTSADDFFLKSTMIPLPPRPRCHVPVKSDLLSPIIIDVDFISRLCFTVVHNDS